MNTLPGSPEIVKNFGVGTYGPIRRPRIPLFKGGESVIRLGLGRWLVNLSPVAQRTNAFWIQRTLEIYRASSDVTRQRIDPIQKLSNYTATPYTSHSSYRTKGAKLTPFFWDSSWAFVHMLPEPLSTRSRRFFAPGIWDSVRPKYPPKNKRSSTWRKNENGKQHSVAGWQELTEHVHNVSEYVCFLKTASSSDAQKKWLSSAWTSYSIRRQLFLHLCCGHHNQQKHTPSSESQHAVERLPQEQHSASSPKHRNKARIYVPIRARRQIQKCMWHPGYFPEHGVLGIASRQFAPKVPGSSVRCTKDSCRSFWWFWMLGGTNTCGMDCLVCSHSYLLSFTRVTKSYLLAPGTTQISSCFTKHWTKFLTHQTGNYPVTCFVSKPSTITLVELSIINTSYQKLPVGPLGAVYCHCCAYTPLETTGRY